MEELVTIGQIIKNQGNKGEVRVFPLTDFPKRFEFLDKVFLEKDEEIIEKEIETVRIHNGKYIAIKFTDINDIGKALELKDYYLKIPRELMVPLKKDEYYIDEIIGFKVKTNKGKELGVLEKVQDTGGTDIFIIKGKKKKYMIPATKEIIIEIDEENKLMIVDPIPGLLDL
ncbi:MAG: ribosome maturation factor RimM [Bacillota bacterium]